MSIYLKQHMFKYICIKQYMFEPDKAKLSSTQIQHGCFCSKSLSWENVENLENLLKAWKMWGKLAKSEKFGTSLRKGGGSWE